MIGSNKNSDCYVLYILLVLRGYLSDGPLGPPQRGDKITEVDLPYRVWSSSHSSVLLSCVDIEFLLPKWIQSFFKHYTHYLYACNFAKGQWRQPMDSMDKIATQVVPSWSVFLTWGPSNLSLMPGNVALKGEILFWLGLFLVHADPSLGIQSQSYCVCPDEPHGAYEQSGWCLLCCI